MVGETVTLIDDSVFVQDPSALNCLNGRVVLTEFSLRRLSNSKNYPTAFASRNAEHACSLLEELTFSNPDKIQTGMSIDGKEDTTLEIYVGKNKIEEKTDRIAYSIKVAKELRRTPDVNVVIVSQDRPLIVKARIEGFQANLFKAAISRKNMYIGHLVCDSSHINNFSPSGTHLTVCGLDLKDFYANQCVTFLGMGTGNKTRTIFDAESGIFKIMSNRYDRMPIRPLNLEQEYAFDLLLDPNLSIVSLDGEYGTGKDFPALAYALAYVVKTRHARVVLISPNRPVGEYQHETLPGDLLEKNLPWMLPFMDNINSLRHSIMNNHQWKRLFNIIKDGLKQMVIEKTIEVAPITYLRGRTLDDCVAIITEAQNINQEDTELIISRMGTNSKFIFTGDIAQLDTGYDFTLSGFTRLIDSYKSDKRAGHIKLVERIRLGSDLAKGY